MGRVELAGAGWGGQQCGLGTLCCFVSLLKQKLGSLAVECWLALNSESPGLQACAMLGFHVFSSAWNLPSRYGLKPGLGRLAHANCFVYFFMDTFRIFLNYELLFLVKCIVTNLVFWLGRETLKVGIFREHTLQKWVVGFLVGLCFCYSALHIKLGLWWYSVLFRENRILPHFGLWFVWGKKVGM